MDFVPVAVTDEDGNEIDINLSSSHIEQFQTMLSKPTPPTLRHPTQYDMIELLNQNWEIKPSQHFTATKVLIGSVIIDTENNYGLLILIFGVYGRDPDIDSHAEQRSSTGSTRQTTSVPSVGQNDFEIFTMRQTEGSNISIELILGTHSFNALVIASTRIDNLVDHPECGP
ncbi:uncharacterized protein EV154DRAFT_548881 [Mucor mucedo]|uniref:uncharacterized protein n=1 Tax=Mucor mucedo TaxID=29922 RepID=UPI00221F7D64|nr:uncharacterized protein EV154DRAFT_548881 [Mucor mucedo]KAI7894736.1 hypothetical protein EV154DRAFT_548881 [Mucor mucedo]